MRHVKSKSNAGKQYQDSPPNKGTGQVQLKEIHDNLGQALLGNAAAKAALASHTVRFEVSNLRCAQYTGLMARESLIDKAEALKDSALSMKLMNAPFVINGLMREVTGKPGDKSVFEEKIVKTKANVEHVPQDVYARTRPNERLVFETLDAFGESVQGIDAR